VYTLYFGLLLIPTKEDEEIEVTVLCDKTITLSSTLVLFFQGWTQHILRSGKNHTLGRILITFTNTIIVI